MKGSDCISVAESYLADARCYLESGEAVNRIADKLGAALMRAMEGWLIAKGHDFSRGRGSGWDITREAFMKNGPVGLRSQIIRLYAETVYLDFELMGDINTSPTLSLAEWKAKAYRCLEESEQAIRQLLSDIESDQDPGASHRR